MAGSIEYGFWYERSRKQQAQDFYLVDGQSGDPYDVWGKSGYLYYPSGKKQAAYQEYTNTKIEKGFVTDSWTPNDMLTVRAGVSYLHATRKGFDYEYPGSEGGYRTEYGNADMDNSWHKVLPMAGAQLQLDDNNQLFYGVGKTFRVPTNTSAYFATLQGVDLSVPETAWNNDFGWRYYGDKLGVSTMLYRSNYNNRVIPGYDETTGLTLYTALKRSKMEGFNGEMSYKFAPSWTVYLSYTYTKATITENLDGGDDGVYPAKGNQLPNTPRNMGYAQVAYDDGHLWGSLMAKASSSRYADYMNTEKAGGYTTLNLAAGYRFDDWNWAHKPYVKVNIANLTDRKAFTYANAVLLASSAGTVYSADGSTRLYGSAPTYSVLEPRTFMVTFGISL